MLLPDHGEQGRDWRGQPGFTELAVSTGEVRQLIYGVFLLRIVRERGFEPPHPCEYTDLNRARLPFRHSRLMTGRLAPLG